MHAYQVGGALGLAVLATVSSTRSDTLIDRGESTASALTSGYHLAFLIGAALVALAIIIIPIVVRTTEDMLQLIPNTLREAVMGLGSPKWKMITLVCYRSVMSGLITGVLLGIARIAGETAPLLFTSLGNLTWSTSLTEAMSSLPVTIYAYAGSPYEDWIGLAWTGALIITVSVLLLNIIARAVLRKP